MIRFQNDRRNADGACFLPVTIHEIANRFDSWIDGNTPHITQNHQNPKTSHFKNLVILPQEKTACFPIPLLFKISHIVYFAYFSKIQKCAWTYSEWVGRRDASQVATNGSGKLQTNLQTLLKLSISCKVNVICISPSKRSRPIRRRSGRLPRSGRAEGTNITTQRNRSNSHGHSKC